MSGNYGCSGSASIPRGERRRRGRLYTVPVCCLQQGGARHEGKPHGGSRHEEGSPRGAIGFQQQIWREIRRLNNRGPLTRRLE